MKLLVVIALLGSPDVSVSAGVIQPVLLRGANVAAAVHHGRLVFEYSHGAWLDYNVVPQLTLSEADRASGIRLYSPWSTGGGVGVVLFDELYAGVEFKVHKYRVTDPVSGQRAHYRTVSIGPVVGYRLFLWQGLHANFYLRYWPNVATSLTNDAVTVGGIQHQAKDLGVFANAGLGWRF